jgi:hypothetical protein
LLQLAFIGGAAAALSPRGNSGFECTS